MRKQIHQECLLGLLIGLALIGPSAQAESVRWKAGAGLATFHLADYRGSDEYNSTAYPFPFVVIRSPLIRADDDGVRGLLFESVAVEFTFSGSASLNTEADNNRARQGMPKLDPTFEFGPALDINLSGDSLSRGWALTLPVRGVYTFSSDGIEHIGNLFNPKLSYRNLALGPDWKLDWAIGWIYADQEFHRYYYSVEPRFARQGRPEYAAKKGDSGFSSEISIGRYHNRFWYGAYLRYDHLSGAVFNNSPLLETDHYFDVGFGVAWIFGQSEPPP